MGNVLKATSIALAPTVFFGASILDAQATTAQATDGVTMVGQAPTHNQGLAQGDVARQIREIDAAKAAGKLALANEAGTSTGEVATEPNSVAYDPITDSLDVNATNPWDADGTLEITVQTPDGPEQQVDIRPVGVGVSVKYNVNLADKVFTRAPGSIVRVYATSGNFDTVLAMEVVDTTKVEPTPTVSPSPSVSPSVTPSPTNTFTPSPEVSPTLPPVTETPTPTLPPNPEVVDQKIKAAPNKLRLGKTAMLDPVTDRGVEIVWDSKTNKWCKIITKGRKPAVKATSSKKAAKENCTVVGDAPSSESDNIIARAAHKKYKIKLVR